MKLRIRLPASTSNLGPGFDCLGLALRMYNWLTVEETGESGLVIDVLGEGAGEIATDERNIVYRAMKRLFDEVGCPVPGLSMTLDNQIPITRGLGSSAAARVGGLIAANLLTGSHFSRERLIDIAAELEGHPDNVVPALVGGLTISVTEKSYISFLRLDPPENLSAVVVVPDFHLSTQTAREILPTEIPKSDAVQNVGRASLLVGAIVRGRFDLLRTAMEDRLHQPYRERLIPGMRAILDAALDAGALGTALSGAGPTLLALTAPEDGETIGGRMQSTWESYGIRSRVFVPGVDRGGAVIEETVLE
ncbi:MAG: homoserine kinase [Candidatus Latescibacteria bacterium]|nr:homoserine kinase [Candidatus Latescibacterota bacterium]